MHSIIKLLIFGLCLFSTQLMGVTLTKLDVIKLELGEFYLFDVKDEGLNIARAIDAYVIDDKTYIAITPILDSLRVKYRFVENNLEIEVFEQKKEILFSEGVEIQSENTEFWFNDGVYTYVPLTTLEQSLGTKAISDTRKLTLELSGHTEEFPYKKIRLNKKQRSFNKYLVDRNNEQSNLQNQRVITVKDTYRMASVPTGTAVIDYTNTGQTETLNGSLQSVSDFAYHSTLVTLTKRDDELLTHTRLSRYPSDQGEKFLGIWDQYSFGDIYSRTASLSNEESRGLGISLSRNSSKNYHENFKTSFEKIGRPGWEADIFHNGVFLKSIIVPDDGVIDINNVELFFGNNTFKIVMFGPYGEREELIEKIDARRTALAEGDKSFNLSLFEYDSSLLNVNLDEFNLDAIAGDFNYGILDNWMIGAKANISNIHNEDNQRVIYSLLNQVSLPGWFLTSNLSINEDIVEQRSSVATSFLPNDSFILQYNSKNNGDEVASEYNLNATYNFRINKITNYFSFNYDEYDNEALNSFTHRINYAGQGFNISNTLVNKVDEGGTVSLGNISFMSKLDSNLRFKMDIPYDVNAIDEFNGDLISASINYNVRTESTNQNILLSGRSFGEQNIWQFGYNLAWKQPTHFFTFGTTVNSNEQWNLRAGISFNFGYDYYNDRLAISRNSMRSEGTLDVHAYLDRRLNGIPDALDHNLQGVTFSGGPGWENITTNKNGRARLFGARTGVTALGSSWTSGTDTLNQKYLVYSHPGSQQVINLPFYLSIEIEFFVTLITEGDNQILSAVPIIAKNLTTGDEYFVDSDMDGYVHFSNLLPGNYQVYIKKDWLLDKGYNTEFYGFTFEAPLTGGFILLPNIELTREKSTTLVQSSLMNIKLDDTNYEQVINSNEKLIHLPPKGGFNAPHSYDQMAEGEFRRVRQQVTQENRITLRNRILNAQKRREFLNYGVDKGAINQIDGMSQSRNFLLSVGNFKTLLSLKRYIKSQGIVNNKIHRAMNAEGNIVYRFEVGPFESEIEANAVGEANYSSLGYRVKTQVAEEYILQGWKVQFLAANDLENAKQLAEGIETVDELYVATKTVGQQSLYCVVSRTFFTKEEANLFLRKLNVDGFIVDTDNYLEVVWSK